MTTLPTTLQLDHDYRDPPDYFEAVPEPPLETSDTLTQVALDLNSRRHDLADLLIAAHKLDRAALRIAEQLHDLESTVTDLQVDQAFAEVDDIPF